MPRVIDYNQLVALLANPTLALSQSKTTNMASAEKVESELEARAIAQFDSLVRKGEVFWEPTEEIKVEQQPFDVCLDRSSKATEHRV